MKVRADFFDVVPDFGEALIVQKEGSVHKHQAICLYTENVSELNQNFDLLGSAQLIINQNCNNRDIGKLLILGLKSLFRIIIKEIKPMNRMCSCPLSKGINAMVNKSTPAMTDRFLGKKEEIKLEVRRSRLYSNFRPVILFFHGEEGSNLGSVGRTSK